MPVASVLENWGVPVSSGQILDQCLHDRLARRASHSLPAIGGNDIFLLVGLCATWSEIQDFRRTVAYGSARYASMIAPFWLRDGAQSSLWTSRTSIDTALTGDPWDGTCSVYTSGGIQSRQFDLGPSDAEIRTLNDCYRLAGLTCEEEPGGITQTQSIPNSAGEVDVVTGPVYSQYSRHSNSPLFNLDSLRGPHHMAELYHDWRVNHSWRPCWSPRWRDNSDAMRMHHSPCFPSSTCHECIAPISKSHADQPAVSVRARPCRRNVRRTKFPIGGRAGVPPPHNFLGQVFGQDRLSAALSGISPSTRMRYVQTWHRRDPLWLGGRYPIGSGVSARIGRQSGRFYHIRVQSSRQYAWYEQRGDF